MKVGLILACLVAFLGGGLAVYCQGRVASIVRRLAGWTVDRGFTDRETPARHDAPSKAEASSCLGARQPPERASERSPNEAVIVLGDAMIAGLAAELTERGHLVSDQTVRGVTLRELAGDLDRILAQQPRAVIVMAGLNESSLPANNSQPLSGRRTSGDLYYQIYTSIFY